MKIEGDPLNTQQEEDEEEVDKFFYLLHLKKGGVAKAKGEGEKEKECTTECKSRRRRDEKAPWALNYESGINSITLLV